MNDILIAAIIGLTAGLIDVTPMIIMKLEKTANMLKTQTTKLKFPN